MHVFHRRFFWFFWKKCWVAHVAEDTRRHATADTRRRRARAGRRAVRRECLAFVVPRSFRKEVKKGVIVCRRHFAVASTTVAGGAGGAGGNPLRCKRLLLM